ncbi:MAG: hypothetical protein WBH63_00025 [Bacillota bacterium]
MSIEVFCTLPVDIPSFPRMITFFVQFIPCFSIDPECYNVLEE